MRSGSVQTLVLLTLRWRMVRSGTGRVGLVLCLSLVGWLLVVAFGAHRALDDVTRATAVELAPGAFVGFGLLALVAPLTGGGANQLMTPDELVAFPVRPRTHFLGGLLLAPVNLVWVVQLLGLTFVTGLLTAAGSGARGALTAVLYVAAVTVLGQVLAWLLVGLRSTRTGRLGAIALGGLGVCAGVLAVTSGRADEILVGPAGRTVARAIAADIGLGHWSAVTSILLLTLCAGVGLGTRVCAWALLRPGDGGASSHTERVARRTCRRSPLAELVAVDRASVWRAPALRRGAFVLAVLPALVAAGAGLPWASLTVLPGLVAAGAGLLFGVNAFCLDAGGAVWLASLPRAPSLALRAKAWVLAETVLVAVALATLGGATRTPAAPTAPELVAVVTCGLVSTAVVVALCLSASVRRPHRADLNGPRDAVAPPGAMVLSSVRLAVPTTLVGVLMSSSALAGVWWLPLAMALPVAGWAALSLRSTFRYYDRPAVRARVVRTVAAG